MAEVEVLLQAIPNLEPEILEYIISLAEDEGIDTNERQELILEYLRSVDVPDNVSLDQLVLSFLEEHARIQAQKSIHKSAKSIDQVAVCLEAIKAPTVATVETTNDQDKELKKELLRRYDVEVTAASALTGNDGEDEEESIMGLGRNENKLRVIKDKEEARLRAKQEQDELKAQKIAQKLKYQGETIKSRTVTRKK